jgi:hypothetical protein
MRMECHARQFDIMFCTVMSRSSSSIIAKKEMMLQDGQEEVKVEVEGEVEVEV